jgi:hypothetical protein
MPEATVVRNEKKWFMTFAALLNGRPNKRGTRVGISAVRRLAEKARCWRRWVFGRLAILEYPVQSGT